MIKLSLAEKTHQKLIILCLGAHSDDIEIGCGGTILRLQQEYPNLLIYWVVFGNGSNHQRRKEGLESAEAFLRNTNKQVIFKDFRDGYFPFVGDVIKDYFEELKHRLDPDIIFTHYRGDLHQDHHLISKLTWNTFRNHLILEYEIPKYDGDLGNPNFFVPLSESICNQKVEFLLKYFTSQKSKHWFTKELLMSLPRLRGMECCAFSSYAEAFYCYKFVI